MFEELQRVAMRLVEQLSERGVMIETLIEVTKQQKILIEKQADALQRSAESLDRQRELIDKLLKQKNHSLYCQN